jgi:hypothetical protein
MARPKGQPKLGGRKKGTPNKLTAAAKDAIAMAFERLGGVDALVEWASEEDNRKVFYAQIWPKIVPLQLSGDPNAPLQAALTVTFRQTSAN